MEGIVFVIVFFTIPAIISTLMLNVCWCAYCNRIRWGKLWWNDTTYCSEACVAKDED